MQTAFVWWYPEALLQSWRGICTKSGLKPAALVNWPEDAAIRQSCSQTQAFKSTAQMTLTLQSRRVTEGGWSAATVTILIANSHLTAVLFFCCLFAAFLFSIFKSYSDVTWCRLSVRCCLFCLLIFPPFPTVAGRPLTKLSNRGNNTYTCGRWRRMVSGESHLPFHELRADTSWLFFDLMLSFLMLFSLVTRVTWVNI